MIFNEFRLMACVLPLGIGSFLFAFFAIKDWKDDFRTLDEMTKTKQSKADVIELVTEFVRSHSNAKQLSG